MSLKVHLLTTRSEDGAQGETACGKRVFRAASDRRIGDEWTAEERLGATRARDGAAFEPDRDSCALCRRAWGRGLGV